MAHIQCWFCGINGSSEDTEHFIWDGDEVSDAWLCVNAVSCGSRRRTYSESLAPVWINGKPVNASAHRQMNEWMSRDQEPVVVRPPWPPRRPEETCDDPRYANRHDPAVSQARAAIWRKIRSAEAFKIGMETVNLPDDYEIDETIEPHINPERGE